MSNCPVGTYMPNKNAAAITDCIPCDAGWYCLEESITPVGQCEAGYYCASPISNPYAQQPALIGSYGPRMVSTKIICEINHICIMLLFLSKGSMSRGNLHRCTRNSKCYCM